MNKTKSKDGELLVQASVLNTVNLLRQHLSDNTTSKEYIHRIRVDIKHLRAWLRLQRDKPGKKEWKNIDRCLSQCAKQLGSVRDEQAVQNTLKSLMYPYRN